ncbi:ribonuclease-III-like-domain-containing protein [Xylariomycetidae sp. FL2044]|nr:ribonuclease-III-like-domain-containing protein [Xylariomycetidae sp. FL2044]
MALNTSRSSARLASRVVRSCRVQPATPACRTIISSSSFSTSANRASEETSEIPRWAKTPERMKAPFSPHITKDPSRSRWKVNSDPQKLDDVLNNFLGRDGERMLPDELKWLAVTHKSFDQGRRGFNDRLAFLGRQICILETTQSIVTSTPNPQELPIDPYADRREPFEDPALRGIDNLSETQPYEVFTLDKLARLAMETGLTEVVRWKPRMPENIKSSGFNVIMAGSVYALIGAITLQHGGKIASRIVRDRVMKKIQSYGA